MGSRRDRASTPLPMCSIIHREDVESLPEARNRGYSYPSGGRVRASQAILRPQIPPNRFRNAQNPRESSLDRD